MGNFFKRVWLFYYEGFRDMTVGKTLWLLIIIKLVIIFAVLKLFFFRSFLGDMTENQKSDYVAKELIERTTDN